MIKHTQTIRWQQPTNCLSVFDHLVGLALKELWDYGSWKSLCLDSCYSPGNWGEVGIKLETKRYIPKVSKFYVEKGYLC